MNIKWDAQKYTNNFSFVHEYGNSVMELLNINCPETILDLGCGCGALTKKLSETGARAIGLDDSEELLKIARSKYPELEFIHADATDFDLGEKVDAVFSNAVFHWIDYDRQNALLHCIHNALSENGQFVFEFGGHGNNSLIHGALKTVFNSMELDYKMPFFFPTIGQYSALLEQAGFKVTYMVLFDRPTALNGSCGLEDWIKMFLKKPFENIPVPMQERIIKQAAALLESQLYRDGIWYADYVRIRGKALKAQSC